MRRGPIDIDVPGAPLVLVLILLAAIDVLAAAATLWVLLPPLGISFFAFAAIYATALALGVLSHIPGGLGVFELAILYAVGGIAPLNAVAAALVIYRAIYFLVPLLLSTVLLASFELGRSLHTATGRRIGQAASQLGPVFLAAATFTVGATLVVSGAMPAFVERLQILHIAVPLWGVEISHFLNSVAGLLLLFAARGLYFRLDGAWWLALSITLLSIPFSLIKGLTVIAPSVSIILLIGLVAGRGQFQRRSSLFSQPPSMGWLIAIGFVIATMVSIFSLPSAISNMRMSCGGNSNSMPPRREPYVRYLAWPYSAWRSASRNCFARLVRARPYRTPRISTGRGVSLPDSSVPRPSSRSWETRVSSSLIRASAS